MKKPVLTALLATLAALMLTGCTPRQEAANGSKVTASPDIAQMQTSNPTAEPTTEPTAEPTEAPKSLDSLPVEVDSNQMINTDIDFDGIMDTILFEKEDRGYDEWDCKLTVTRGANGTEPFVYEISRGKGVRLIIIDCDKTDSRLDMLLCWDQGSDDRASLICRVNEDASGMFTEEGGYYFSISESGLKDGEFTAAFYSDILGTQWFCTPATVDNDGIKFLDGYRFSGSDDYWMTEQSLSREMTVKIVNSDGSIGEEVAVPAGEHIVPLITDCETYVDIRIPDGRTGRLGLMFKGDSFPGIYLNDIAQDDYFSASLKYSG